MPATYEGGCHCGRVRFSVTADLDRVTYCNCSVCTKKGFLHLIVPPEQFELLSGKDALATYTFNTGVAKHTFCRHCGMPAARIVELVEHGVIEAVGDEPERWRFRAMSVRRVRSAGRLEQDLGVNLAGAALALDLLAELESLRARLARLGAGDD